MGYNYTFLGEICIDWMDYTYSEIQHIIERLDREINLEGLGWIITDWSDPSIQGVDGNLNYDKDLDTILLIFKKCGVKCYYGFITRVGESPGDVVQYIAQQDTIVVQRM